MNCTNPSVLTVPCCFIVTQLIEKTVRNHSTRRSYRSSLQFHSLCYISGSRTTTNQLSSIAIWTTPHSISRHNALIWYESVQRSFVLCICAEPKIQIKFSFPLSSPSLYENIRRLHFTSNIFCFVYSELNFTVYTIHPSSYIRLTFTFLWT